MGVPRIVAVATATPPHRFDQATLLRIAGYDDALRSGFFTNSQIDGRHLYLDPETFRPNESVDEMSARFRRGAIELGAEAVRRAVERAGWELADVDFLATTTCTGRLCPSLDAHLIAELGLKSTIQRVHVGDTGCASAMVALQQAVNHLHAFPRHRAVVVAVEICSAAYFLDDRVVISHQSLFRSEYLPAMGFGFPGGRQRVVLSKDVRRIGAAMMKEMAERLMESQGLKKEDVRHFVLHSAGRRVIEQARRLLGLDHAQVAHSRHVLKRFGNMSSATVLFVLEETLRSGQPVTGDWGLMVALGPGFAAEGALLRW